MKLALIQLTLIFSLTSWAQRGPYFPSFDKAPITHGQVIFNSPDLQQVSAQIYMGEVVIQKTVGEFEVGPMIYKCKFNEDDGAYGSLGCSYLRYDRSKAISYSSCTIYDISDYSCY